jgi:hypothetical protein
MVKLNKITGLVLAIFLSNAAYASVDLIAIADLDGNYEDLASETSGRLENGVIGNRLGGIGSGLAYAGGNIFLGLPDRGPNANLYNASVDDTVSYIDRFHTFEMMLTPNDIGAALPYNLTPIIKETTLLSSIRPLVYGTGDGIGNQVDGATPMGSGAPSLNNRHRYYFTGRSDGFDSTKLSTNPNNARLDPEGIRVSRDGQSVFITDEYGPFVYQFDRSTGVRINTFNLPTNLAITKLSAQKDVEIAGNTVGRTTNKGMEGLAITPDGKTLVGAMQANLLQDKKKSVRIVTIDIKSGVTHQYAYLLTKGSGISEIIAVNNHQFLVDERDGSGFGDTPNLDQVASPAEEKKLFLIDLNGAQEVSDKSGDLAAYAMPKTLFLDLVEKLTDHGINPYFIPSKIEGLAFGQDVIINGETKHTLYITNDNDFLGMVADPLTSPADSSRGLVANPNKIYVFAFGDDDLPAFVPQQIKQNRMRHEHEEQHNHW